MYLITWEGKAKALLFGGSDFSSEREKVTIECGRSGGRVMDCGLRGLRKWAEAKEAAQGEPQAPL